MKKKKARIDTYYCNIYDIYLVVANEYVELSELQKLYTYSDGNEIDSFMFDSICSTAACIRKKDKVNVILVKYNHGNKTATNKVLDLINTCSHEAAHVAIDIYALINQTLCSCSSEPFCYLVGWASECIYKTLKKM